MVESHLTTHNNFLKYSRNITLGQTAIVLFSMACMNFVRCTRDLVLMLRESWLVGIPILPSTGLVVFTMQRSLKLAAFAMWMISSWQFFIYYGTLSMILADVDIILECCTLTLIYIMAMAYKKHSSQQTEYSHYPFTNMIQKTSFQEREITMKSEQDQENITVSTSHYEMELTTHPTSPYSKPS